MPAPPAASLPWRLRPAGPADVPALAALYASTARRLGPACYTPAQVEAWASVGTDLPAFADYVLLADTWLAEAAGPASASGPGEGPALLGFSGMDAGGEVKSLYVHHSSQRRGLASHLLAHALARAQAGGIRHCAAWATPFSLPVFQRAGFRLVERVQAPFAGTLFERFRVAR